MNYHQEAGKSSHRRRKMLSILTAAHCKAEEFAGVVTMLISLPDLAYVSQVFTFLSFLHFPFNQQKVSFSAGSLSLVKMSCDRGCMDRKPHIPLGLAIWNGVNISLGFCFRRFKLAVQRRSVLHPLRSEPSNSVRKLQSAARPQAQVYTQAAVWKSPCPAKIKGQSPVWSASTDSLGCKSQGWLGQPAPHSMPGL